MYRVAPPCLIIIFGMAAIYRASFEAPFGATPEQTNEIILMRRAVYHEFALSAGLVILLMAAGLVYRRTGQVKHIPDDTEDQGTAS
jgi:hypothetical protein